MKKKMLLSKKPLPATRAMISAAKQDHGEKVKANCYNYGREYNRYFTAHKTRNYYRTQMAADGNVREADLYTRHELAQGIKEPAYRIFLDRDNDNFITYNMRTGKWTTAMIENLDTCEEYLPYGAQRGANVATEQTRKLVAAYVGKYGVPTERQLQDVEMSVLAFQRRVRGRSLAEKHKRETDRWDSDMAAVPDTLPKDWAKFINDRVLEHYIFFNRKERQGYCTHCGCHTPIKDGIKHNDAGKCAVCGVKAQYKSRGKQKSVHFGNRASIIQRTTDGRFVYRQFFAQITAKRDDDYRSEINMDEEYRCIFSREAHSGNYITRAAEEYAFGCYRYTGIERWCEPGKLKGSQYNLCYNGPGYYHASIPYTANLKRVFRGTALQYVPMAEILKRIVGRVSVISFVCDAGARSAFPYEALWKSGLKRYVTVQAKNCGSYGGQHNWTVGDGMKPWECVYLDRERFKQAVRIDATSRQLGILPKAKELGVRLEDAQLKWLDEYGGRDVKEKPMNYFTAQTPHRIIRYMSEVLGAERTDKKAPGEKEALWYDYLDAARELGWDFHDRSIFFPQNIQRAHDEATRLYEAAKDTLERKRLAEQDAKMRKIAHGIKKLFRYRNAKYCIKIPGEYIDFRHEGQAQHNCVATYYEKVLDGKCIVFFVRERSKPNASFCTVEVRADEAGGFKIWQNRAAYNKPAPDEAVRFVQEAVRAAERIMKTEQTSDKKSESRTNVRKSA
ncbi:MAG: PcfJ domain-containing protein [Lachnospiraceae bacterium]|nr:PcfJ domain-containing protein [Lachnospiraceae bacterium]